MKKSMALTAACIVALVLTATLAAGTTRHRTPRREAAATGEHDGDGDRDRGARFEVKDPDKEAKPGTITPAREAFINRAYPRTYIPAAAVQKATRATRRMPTRLNRSHFRAGTPDVAAAAGVGADWSFLGPTTGFAPGPTTESLKDSVTSGRVTALAIDPHCGQPGGGCRLWVAAAGGGIWRTDDAKAATVSWTALENGLPTNAFGSLIVDPNDSSSNTLYAGTGEANAINQAGLGLYKSTDGGDHWSLVPGSFEVSHDRSIGAVKVDPTDSDTIWIGTADGRQGQSNVNGGAVPPPGAPPLGVYVSHDGGTSFTQAFSLPDELNPGFEEDGGVTDIELDRANPDAVYASLLDGGIWRTDAADETGGDASWKQVFAPTGSFFNRTEFAVTRIAGKTRIYAGDGGFNADLTAPTGEFFRTDNANVPAATLLGPTSDNDGWTKLSSPNNGDPGFAAHELCQSQCDYDLFVDVDPTNANVVWFGGSMVYEEIRPLQDASLEGIAPWRSNGRAVMRSSNAGVSWKDMTADSEGQLQPGRHEYEQMHPDQHAIVFDPTNSKVAFVGSDGGVVRTDGTFDDMSAECDDPAREIVTETDPVQKAADLQDCHSWLSSVPHRIINLNDGLADMQFVQLSVDPKDPLGDLLGGTQDNGTFSYSATLSPGRSWFESVNGDGAASGFDVGDSNIRYHTYFLGLGDINHHGSDPNTWTFITQPVAESGEAVSFYTPVIMDPKVPGTIYLAAQHVWRTKDNGGDQAALEANCLSPGGVPQYTGNITCGDFEPIGADLTTSAGSKDGSYLAAVERAPSDTSTLWVGGRRGRLYVSKNADEPKAEKVGFDRIDTDSQPRRFVSGIAVDPADPNHAYVSFSGYNASTPGEPGHVFDVRYDPAASSATWTSLDANLPDTPITDVAFDDATGDLYAATDYTVLRRPDASDAWGQAADGLPLASVTNIVLRSDGRVLYGATYGRAAWRLALAPAARISGADELQEGQSAVYDGSQSKAFGDAPLAYSWTLPDGSHASTRSVTYRAGGTGPKTLTLTVEAPDGRSATTRKTVNVTTGGGGGEGGGGGGQPGFALIKLRSRVVRLGKHRYFRVRLTCPAANTLGCPGTAKVTTKISGRTRRLGVKTLSIPRGRSTTIRLRLSRTLLRRLAHHRRLSTTIAIAQIDPLLKTHRQRLRLLIRLRR
jgi:hypothetical protein